MEKSTSHQVHAICANTKNDCALTRDFLILKSLQELS